MAGDCAGDFYGKFHALQTFAGHPLRPHFLGDADGCLARGFRFFTVSARYQIQQGHWQPDVYFGLCAPRHCDEGHVEVSLAPAYLDFLLRFEGFTGQLFDLEVEASDFSLRWPSAHWLWLLLPVAFGTACDLVSLGPGKDLGLRHQISRLFQLPLQGHLEAVSALRAVGTLAILGYHVFFLKRDLAKVASMPWFARRLQHLCILYSSVFSAISVFLMNRSFEEQRRPGGGARAWLRWGVARLWRKALRQVPALLLAYAMFHQGLLLLPLDVAARSSLEGKKRLCSSFEDSFTPECWNTFANWAILRDAQLDVTMAVLLVFRGIVGDLLGLALTGALLAVALQSILQEDLGDENLLWSLPYRRLPETLSTMIMATWLPSLRFPGSWTLALAVGLVVLTVQSDWLVSSQDEVATVQLDGRKRAIDMQARLMLAFGWAPLGASVLLVANAESTMLKVMAGHWLWGTIGSQLSLPMLLVHNVLFVVIEGAALPGPSWDYPFSYMIFFSLLLVVLCASWLLSAMLQLLFLGPVQELLWRPMAWADE